MYNFIAGLLLVKLWHILVSVFAARTMKVKRPFVKTKEYVWRQNKDMWED